jgi:hypothetical protein
MNSLRATCTSIPFKSIDQAVLSFDGACLHIDLPGGGFSVPAQGNWPGQVRVPAKWFQMMVKMPPEHDPIVFRVEENQLHVENASIACTVQGIWRAMIQLPINAPPGMLLALALRYTPADIESSGLSDRVKRAREQFEGRIQFAAKSLKAYGLTLDKLRVLVLSHIKNDPGLNRF